MTKDALRLENVMDVTVDNSGIGNVPAASSKQPIHLNHACIGQLKQKSAKTWARQERNPKASIIIRVSYLWTTCPECLMEIV